MITKQIIRSVMLVLVLGGLAIWANREYRKFRPEAGADDIPAVVGNQVVVTYFISGERCDSCKKIEALARETAGKDFAAEFSKHQLVFRVVDTGEPANRHYIGDYKLTSKTVVISHRQDGRETGWKDMDKVWDLLDDPVAFRAYLAVPIREYLGSSFR